MTSPDPVCHVLREALIRCHLRTAGLGSRNTFRDPPPGAARTPPRTGQPGRPGLFAPSARDRDPISERVLIEEPAGVVPVRVRRMSLRFLAVLLQKNPSVGRQIDQEFLNHAGSCLARVLGETMEARYVVPGSVPSRIPKLVHLQFGLLNREQRLTGSEPLAHNRRQEVIRLACALAPGRFLHQRIIDVRVKRQAYLPEAAPLAPRRIWIAARNPS